ncbi:hypothetical protein LSPH26S_03806 [Lysinibacillus sphaericus]
MLGVPGVLRVRAGAAEPAGGHARGVDRQPGVVRGYRLPVEGTPREPGLTAAAPIPMSRGRAHPVESTRGTAAPRPPRGRMRAAPAGAADRRSR